MEELWLPNSAVDSLIQIFQEADISLSFSLFALKEDVKLSPSRCGAFVGGRGRKRRLARGAGVRG